MGNRKQDGEMEGRSEGGQERREGGKRIRRTGVSQTQMVPALFLVFFFLATHVFIALGMPLETEDKAHRLRWADPVTEGSDR